MNLRHSQMIRYEDILPKSDKKLKKLHLFTTLLFLALFAFPLFPLKITNVIFMLFALLTLIIFIIKPVPVGKTIMGNIIFVLPFIPYLIELLVSGFDPIARFEFEKKILIFTAPLLIPVFIQLTGFLNYKICLLIFSLSVTIITMIAFAILGLNNTLFHAVSYTNGAFQLRDSFENISHLHPTYYSLFALCSVCFLMYQPIERFKVFRLLKLLSMVLLISMILLLAVRIVVIAAIIIILIYIIKLKTTIFRKLLFFGGALGILMLLIILVPSLQNRFTEIAAMAGGKAGSENTMEQRKTILKCSASVFLENIWTGCGSRNFQNKLNACYAADGMQISDNRSFNPHNQFLSIGINYGILILILFVICIYFILRKILKIPEAIYFAVAIIFVFLSESILERQMGVYFFVLISMLFYNNVKSLGIQTSRYL